MTRELTSGQQAAIQAETGTVVYLLELKFWTGSSETEVRLATAGDDINADPDGTGEVTFQGSGGWLSWGGAQETARERAQGTRIRLSGVEQTIISALLNNSFRGREARIWRATVTDGSVSDTLLIFRGRQLGDYSITETPGSHEGPATVDIETRVRSRLADLRQSKPVRTNQRSHNAMLARAGLSTGDTYFQNVPNLPGRRIFWGTNAPDEATTSGGGAGPRGGGGGGGRGGRGPDDPTGRR